LVGVMGSKPIHVMSVEERATLPKTTDFFIDLGMGKKEVEEIISVGDAVTRQRELIEMGNCVNCKSIDNRISVYILIEVLKNIQAFPYDLYAVFTVQEEMGARGAVLASHSVNPDFAIALDIALDTTIAYDVPGAKPQEMITQLGKGAAIKLLDSSVIADRRLVAYLKQTANENNIVWQTEILTGGNTDAGPMQRSGKLGAIAGAISIPTRHIHQVIEMADKNDVIAVVNLLDKAISGLAQYNWEH
ncbi:MAG: aminopeptidase Metallo peptidase family, partial [Bacteroidota bacterium]